MLNLEVKTILSQAEAVAKVKAFFGDGGQGMKLAEGSDTCLTFEGGGGYVTANIATEGKITTIGFITQEWDYQVREFAERFSR
jgi:hypothetical protein